MRWLTLLALVSWAAPTLAQEAPTADLHVREIEALDQETLDKAEALFFEGLSSYRAGTFEEAAVKFQEAYVLARHRDLLFNLARSRERLGDKEGAVEWYRAYLATQPADVTAVVHRIRQLGGDPTPKRATVDEQRTVDTPEGPQVVEEGAGPWPWVALGVGVAAAGAGAALGILALDDASAARDAERRSTASSLKDSAESKALIADISFGVSAVAVGTAVFLWWWADHEADAQGDIKVGATPQGFSVGYETRW